MTIALGSGHIAVAQPSDPATPVVPSLVEGDHLKRPPLAAQSLGEQPARKPAYAGLHLRQNPEGVVVAGVQPGPLGGDGLKSPSIWRGDLIVSINGQSLDVAGYVRLVKSLAAGDALRVVYRRSANADPGAAIPQGDPNGEERVVQIVLDDATRWTGTVGQGLAPGRFILPAQSGALEDRIVTTAAALGLRSEPRGLDALAANLASLQQRLLDPNSLPAVVHGLDRPLSLDRVEADFAVEVHPLAQPQPLERTLREIHQFLVRTLDVRDLTWGPDLATELATARRRYRELAVGLLTGLRDDTAALSPDFPRYLELMRESRAFLPLALALLPQTAQHTSALEAFAQAVPASPQPVPAELSERVRSAVDGPVLGAKLVDGELWVVGSDAANRYDMDRIAAVFDVGGSDIYSFSHPYAGSYQILIDQSGDDIYESNGDLAGPASAVFSVALVDDRGGDDLYRSSHQGGIATALFGVAILIDANGSDQYLNDSAGAGWSQGVGVYGAGLLIDRAGDDRYHAQVLSQGVGGPGGVGLIVDTAGDDIYVANGPHFPSGYGTPGVFAGLSQGLGFGIRGYAAGGVGAIYDFSGNDHYAVGEFGQGTGYFQGLGILHDASGDDLYLGSRYAQGSAAHQAAGVLIDDGGNDAYSCPGSAAQGAAWDQSAALLIDRAGNDTYFGSGLAQGSAAQQAIGILLDLDGEDTYSCTGPCLGESDDNTYHYDEDELFNFSALIDRGRKVDTYSRSRSNSALLRTGTLEEDRPSQSLCCGLFIDE